MPVGSGLISGAWQTDWFKHGCTCNNSLWFLDRLKQLDFHQQKKLFILLLNFNSPFAKTMIIWHEMNWEISIQYKKCIKSEDLVIKSKPFQIFHQSLKRNMYYQHKVGFSFFVLFSLFIKVLLNHR